MFITMLTAPQKFSGENALMHHNSQTKIASKTLATLGKGNLSAGRATLKLNPNHVLENQPANGA